MCLKCAAETGEDVQCQGSNSRSSLPCTAVSEIDEPLEIVRPAYSRLLYILTTNCKL